MARNNYRNNYGYNNPFRANDRDEDRPWRESRSNRSYDYDRPNYLDRDDFQRNDYESRWRSEDENRWDRNNRSRYSAERDNRSERNQWDESGYGWNTLKDRYNYDDQFSPESRDRKDREWWTTSRDDREGRREDSRYGSYQNRGTVFSRNYWDDDYNRGNTRNEYSYRNNGRYYPEDSRSNWNEEYNFRSEREEDDDRYIGRFRGSRQDRDQRFSNDRYPEDRYNRPYRNDDLFEEDSFENTGNYGSRNRSRDMQERERSGSRRKSSERRYPEYYY